MPPRERHTVRSHGIVLCRTNYNESDVVVTLLTHSLGKVAAIAKGARRSLKRYIGGLSPSVLGDALIRFSGDDLSYLDSFEVIKDRMEYGREFTKSVHAGYVLEICDRLTGQGQTEPTAYDLLATYLDWLEIHQASPTRLRVFEFGLLSALGLAPHFTNCVQCGVTAPTSGLMRFDPRRGAMVCSRCTDEGEPLSEKTWRALLSLQTATFENVEELPKDLNIACRGITLALIYQHLQAPLKSIAFMGKLGTFVSTSR